MYGYVWFTILNTFVSVGLFLMPDCDLIDPSCRCFRSGAT